MPATYHVAVLLCVLCLPLSAFAAISKGKFGVLVDSYAFEKIGGHVKLVASVGSLSAFVLLMLSNVFLPALLVVSVAYAVAGYLVLLRTATYPRPRHSSAGEAANPKQPKTIDRKSLMRWQILLTVGGSAVLVYCLIALFSVPMPNS